MEVLLASLGAISAERLAARHVAGGGHAAPWLLAARVLRNGPLLTWEELWDVLRWYAHNRGYDHNRAWGAGSAPAEADEDTEKVQNARKAYEQYGTHTMAETFCAVSGLDPLGSKISACPAGKDRPKGLNAAFPREDVEAEVRQILERHVGELPFVDAAFIRCIMEDWTALACPGIWLPRRYGQVHADGRRSRGGLLFGQLIPRFENRIIGICPFRFAQLYRAALHGKERPTGAEQAAAAALATRQAKTPGKACPEFLLYRWAMQVANLRVLGAVPRPLSVEERQALHQLMQEKGYFTKGEYTKAVGKVVGGQPTNVREILTHPDADESLILDPVRKLLATHTMWKEVVPLLPERLHKRLRGQLRRGKPVVLGALLEAAGEPLPEVEAALERVCAGLKPRKGKPAPTVQSLRAEATHLPPLSGRAPFAREVLREVAEFVFSTARHPTEEGGPIYRSPEVLGHEAARPLASQTNNHLIRHRLIILERLCRHLIAEFAGGQAACVRRVVVEVNRELRELSGLTQKEIKQEQGLRLAEHRKVVARLEEALRGTGAMINAGLIRKARIAADMGWKCPYTGKSYDEADLASGKVDKDHILPRSQRPSDSLDSLVLTFSEVNKLKGNRTALQFIQECARQPLPGGLQLKTVERYCADVEALETRRGHDDDQRRKKRRQERLLQLEVIEKEFLPRDLTQTSHLARLGAQTVRRVFGAEAGESGGDGPATISLPGGVTGLVRKAWKLLGCLSTANPDVLYQPGGAARTKAEVRDITHLHHALDACTLAYAARLHPGDQRVWELLRQRRLNPTERQELEQRLGRKKLVEFGGKDNQPRLADLPNPVKEQIRKRLAERRVVQHIPAEMHGLRVEQNPWRVLKVEDGKATLRQRNRQADGTRSGPKISQENVEKLLGLQPQGGGGKLKANQSVLVIPENYGLALEPELRIIPFHKVAIRLRELRKANGGKPVRVLRRGMLIRVATGRYEGVWKVFSVKNNAAGIALDLGAPDAVRTQKTNVLVQTLLKNGLELRKGSLTGG